jgi:flagellar FliL protein
MADKKPEEGESEAPPKKKGKLLLFIIIGVLVLVLAGGGAFFMLKKKSHSDDEEAGDDGAAKTEQARKKKDHPDAPPVFVKLEPFTVKLQADQQESYLQATPELRVVDMPIGEKIKQYMPEIRHKVLLLMSGKKPSDLSTPQGVQQLANEMRDAINVIIDGPKAKSKSKGKEAAAPDAPPPPPSDTADPDDSVQAVLFTSFIIQ